MTQKFLKPLQHPVPTGLFKGIHPELPSSSPVTKQTHTALEFGLVRHHANNSYPKERRGVCACRATHRSAPKKPCLCCIICVILTQIHKASFSMGWVDMLWFFNLGNAFQTWFYFTYMYFSVSALPSTGVLTRMVQH